MDRRRDSRRQEEDGEDAAAAATTGERLYSKLEEALEIKSLRRIIGAYLNYQDAAEEDIRRYERSFRKLPPSHKALLSHLPLKYQRLRWCISVNTHFIMSMLQAFDPPLDMSEDIYIDEDENLHEDENLQNVTENHLAESAKCSINGSHFSSIESTTSGKVDNVTDKSLERSTKEEEIHMEASCKSSAETFVTSEHQKGSSNGSMNNEKVVCDPAACCSNSTANERGMTPKPYWMDPSIQLNVPLVDVDKVRCIIRNIVRDWASEGQKERDQCYKPILDELNFLFPDRCKERPPCCLVPGAGLGRLALEISCLGFVSQGNEFSYYMMICSSFILNYTQKAGDCTIYPWIHSNCNSISDSDQLRPVSFPDIHPSSAGITEGFSMCAGDFVEVYNDESQEASWDAVVTCFFLDTAHNIVEYIETIWKILKHGGVWINLGPLLYHFADSYVPEDEMSIELSLEDVKKVALHCGFVLEKENIIETTYTTNPRSMMQNRYYAAFWTMRKN
ncbi:carnosine N-methyltransferase isoform X1 [Canna indica]|uniref:carnosine N-methyltransferase n=1 Tax=Canna indica TaxID=4628 RepID=A0AAQ3KFG6_9LILI|nr:carnosine N-methyltransferase isoform X1 [Canna indica]